MTAIFVHPTLAQWTENGISAMLKAKTREEFDKSFEEFIAKEAQITVNGAPMSLEEYRQHMLQVSAAATLTEFVEVKFDGVVEQQANQNWAGSVGVFCSETVYKKIHVFAVPAESKVSFSAYVEIKQDPSVSREFFENRRVFVLKQVLTEESVPIKPFLPANLPPVEPPA